MAGPGPAGTTGVGMANRRRALVVEGSGADAAGSVAAARERTGGGALAGEVGSGAERSPLGGEHDGPAVGVGVEGLERCRDLPRSEEHTSELQSLMRISYAVLCLNKKKKHSVTPPNLIYHTTAHMCHTT